MSESELHLEATQKRVGEIVGEIEKQTAAEIVVALRPRSGFYRHADYLFGFALALGDLTLFLFHPRAMRVDVFPLEIVAVFAIGAVVSASFAPLRRLLLARSLMDQNVERAARACFVDLGISRTRGRTGVLVYVSLFERSIRVVADTGVPDDESWQRAKAALEAALAPVPDVARFCEALRGLGEPLAKSLPVAADDVNELADGVNVE